MRIQIVEDDRALSDGIRLALREDGITFIQSSSVRQAKEDFGANVPDIVILDINLPDGSGYDYLQWVKERSDVLVLILTANDMETDEVMGLTLGADDYIVKPFLPRELILRIGVILRRCYKEEQPVVRLAGCTVDFERAQVIKGEEKLPLTAKEFALLSALYRNSGKIVTIDMLCQAVWGDNPYGYENSLMAHIRRIREKIEENPSKPVSLITVKGLGYKLIVKE